MTAWLIPIGHFFFRTRDLVFPVVLLTLAFSTRPLVIGGDWRLDRRLDAAGFVVASIGELLRVAVIGFAYITRGGRNRRIVADSLVQTGIFAHSRNPLYLGNLLIVKASPSCMARGGSTWWVSPFFVFAYVAIVCAEEDFLAAQVRPADQDYCRRVNRFIPSIRGLRRTLAPMTFDWKKVVRKVRHAVRMDERYAGDRPAGTRGHAGRAPNTPDPNRGRRDVELLAMAYLTARVLKLRGALGSG